MLVHGAEHWALGTRPVTIGRLPECDISLRGDKVSRNHAYIVSTPQGPLLVDGSRLGTMVNGEVMRAPIFLAEGDEIKIGVWVLNVALNDVPTQVTDEREAKGSVSRRVIRWIRRYGPSEVLGTIAAVGAATGAQRATGSTVAGAFAGTIAETVVFYGIMFLRESIRAAYVAGTRGRPFRSGDLVPVFRNLMLEFGVAETVDTLFLRPLCIGLGLRFIGGQLGALAGKLASDVAFYGPVLTIYEWRLARDHAKHRADRSRRTTSAARRAED